jgi:nucleotide-binding universal stress UspA family protein
VVAQACVEHGSPAGVLVDRARHARLAVLGRHGAGRFAGALIGSVTSGVLHHAACPVVVVPEGLDEDVPEGNLPVLVGFDGSAESFGALEAGCDQARLRGAALTVVTAWTVGAETSRPTYWATAYPSRAPGEVAVAEGERTLDRARSWFTPQHDLTVSYDLAEGRAQEVLVRRSRHAGLVVVGTRGRGGFTSLVLGSVSRAVVHRAHCPVLVTRSPRAVQETWPTEDRPVAQQEQVPQQARQQEPDALAR